MIPAEMGFCLLFLSIDLSKSSESYLLQNTLGESGYDVMMISQKSVLAVDKI